MPPGQADPNTTMAQVYEYIGDKFERYHGNFKRVFPLAVLALARQDAQDPDLQMSDEEITRFAEQTPGYRLLSVLDEKLNRWAPWVLDMVPELRLTKAFQREYLYAFRRCMKRAINGGILSPAPLGLSREWIELRTLLANTLPIDDLKLELRLANGETDFFGHSLARKSPKRTKNEFRIQLHGFNLMARFMCANGINDPRDVRPEHICPGPGSWYHDRKDGKQHDLKVFYCSKAAWEILRHIKPEWNLIPWPSANEDRFYGLLEGERPELLERMLADIEKLNLGAGTMRNIRVTTYRLMGYLWKVEGFDVNALCRELEEPAQLGWILYGGLPEHDGWRPPDPRDETSQIFCDPDYRARLLARIRKANRNGTEEGDCRANSLLAMYMDWGSRRGIFGGLMTTLSSFRIANQRYLHGSANQQGWSWEMTASIRKRKLESPPKPWQRRKDILGNHKDTWKRFVTVVDRMESHANGLLAKMEAEEDPEKRMDRTRHWAIAIRDHLIVCFLLAFQLRRGNLRALKLGEELSHDTYTIHIPGNRAKARKPINKAFPRRGAFVDLAGLLDLYISEARVHLIPEGEDTPYLFLPMPSESGCRVRDEEGRLLLSEMNINRIIRKACENHFHDIMPPGEKFLNPHVFRDMFSNFVYMEPGGDVIASQGLANTVETMRLHYLGLHVSRDDDVRNFIEGIDVDSPIHDELSSRKEVRILIETSLGPEATPKKVSDLMRIFDRWASPDLMDSVTKQAVALAAWR